MSRRSDDAVRDWDRACAESVERALHALPREAQNARSLAVLRSTRAGVDCLIGLWEGLAEAFDLPGGWADGEDHHNRLLSLLGLFGPDDESAEIGEHSWSLLLANRPDLAGPDDEPTAPGQVDALRSILAGLCRRKVDELESLWLALPDPGSARVSVGEEAAFTFDAQDLNLHRHEARLDREARAVIAQLTRLEQTGADLLASVRSEPDPDPMPAPNEADPEPTAPTEPEPAPISPNEPNATPPVAASLTIDRDRDGRTWPLSEWAGVLDVSPMR